MKKICYMLLVVCTLSLHLFGCNQNIEEDFEKEEKTRTEKCQLKVSDLFTKDERRIWFVTAEEETTLSYHDNVYAVYVVENGKATGYTGVGELGDYDKMTDDEIVQYLIGNSSEYHNKLYYDGECVIDFSYTLDNSGNKVEKQAIEFELLEKTSMYNMGRNFEIDEILSVPQTILSKQYFGFVDKDGSRLISKYDYKTDIEIVYNELGDTIFGDENKEDEENKNAGNVNEVVDTLYRAFSSTIAYEQVTCQEQDITLTIDSNGIVVNDTDSFDDDFIISLSKVFREGVISVEDAEKCIVESTVNKLGLEKTIVCTVTSDGEIKAQCGNVVVSNRRGY